jgi:hypothetical protein
MNPLSSQLSIVQVRFGAGQIEPTLFGLRVMAFMAVSFDDLHHGAEVIGQAEIGA